MVESSVESPTEAMVFESPRSAYMGTVVYCVLMSPVIAIVPAGIALILIVGIWQLAVGPVAIVCGIVLFGLGLWGAIAFWRSRCVGSILIDETGFTLRGLFVKRRFLLDEVRLLTLARPSGRTLNRLMVVTAQISRVIQPAIHLREDEARSCFDALRALCAHTPAVGPDDEAYQPVDPAFKPNAAAVLKQAYRRRAVLSLCAAVAFAVAAPAILGWFNPGSGGMGLVSVGRAVGAAIASIGLFLYAVRMFVKSSSLRGGSGAEQEDDAASP